MWSKAALLSFNHQISFLYHENVIFYNLQLLDELDIFYLNEHKKSPKMIWGRTISWFSHASFKPA